MTTSDLPRFSQLDNWVKQRFTDGGEFEVGEGTGDVFASDNYKWVLRKTGTSDTMIIEVTERAVLSAEIGVRLKEAEEHVAGLRAGSLKRILIKEAEVVPT